MSEKRFGESMNSRRHIEAELGAHGINQSAEWRDAIKNEGAEKLFKFLKENEKFHNEEKINKFKDTYDSIERLEILRKMSLSEAIRCIRHFLGTGSAYYIEKRLEFYENLVEDNSSVTPEDVRLGLRRDIAFSAMIGTPELGIYKIANKRLKEANKDRSHMLVLRGYHSYIDEDSIGYAYPFLRKLYLSSRKQVEKRYTDREGLDENFIEHKAVLLAADWLEESMDYNPSDRSPESPYVSKPKEAIDWVRLGPQVKKQLRGMRHKIQGIDLSGIGRFIGKSGDSRYEHERRRLYGQIKVLSSENNYGKEKEKFTTRENEIAIKKQENWLSKKKIDLYNQLQKDTSNIESSGISDNEKEEHLQSLLLAYNKQIASLEEEVRIEVSRFQHRTPEALLGELKERQDVVAEKYNSSKNLAQKAIELYFKEKSTLANNQDSAIDWINKAPFGVINWTHKALQRGVSLETAFGYAKATYMFPGIEITRDLIKKSETIGKEQVENIVSISEYNNKQNLTVSPTEILGLANYNIEFYKSLLEKGYSVECLAAHSWLNDRAILNIHSSFPHEDKKSKQQAWCVKNAQYVPAGWKGQRLGQIVFNRLEAGVDANLHDATYWLSEFEVPDKKNGIVYKDHNKEMALIYSITDVPSDLRRRVPTKPNKYSDLFSDSAAVIIYESALSLMNGGSADFDKIRQAVHEKLQGYKDNPKKARSLKVALPELEETIEKYLAELSEIISKGEERENFSALIGDLRSTSKRRTEYIDTAQTWLSAHGMTPRNILTIAWSNRELALADGCADNPRSIKQWADLNTLRSSYNQMRKAGNLPDNIKKADLLKYAPVLSELVRHYDGVTSINTLSRLKEKFNPDFEIPPMKINLGDGWVGEIFMKNDPRGMTIGNDTGCCMTLGGDSNSCIQAGYEKPQYGFFALHRNDQIVGQSFIYTNKEEAPQTIICDNIEVNEGRNMGQVLDRYKQFFTIYTKTQLRRGFDFSKIQIGEGYTDVGISHLKKATSVPMNDSYIYSDAEKQRVLLQLEKNKVKELKNLKTSLFDPADWQNAREEILELEKQAFEGHGYDERQLEAEFTNPENVVVVIRDKDKVIGYSTALPMKDGSLYISSTSISKTHQGRGLVADLKHAMDNESSRRGFKHYTSDTRIDNGYADKIKRNYVVVEEGKPFVTPLGKQVHLKLEIPDHRPPRTLEGAREILRKKPKFEFKTISKKQASVIAELESNIYPSGLRQGEDFFEEELDFEPGEEYYNASFIISENETGKETPVGYVVAYISEEPETNYDKPVLYVSDMALLPDYQKKGYGIEAIGKLIDYAMSQQGIAIEFHARAKTSYPALLHVQNKLRKFGYQIAEDELHKNYFDDDEGNSEDVHLVRLEHVAPKEKKAA